MKRVHIPTRARPIASRGRSRGSGNASSRYSLIAVDSRTTKPSWTSTGTMPSGLSARNSGVRCSKRRRFSTRPSYSSRFSASASRTFCEQVEVQAWWRTSVMASGSLRLAIQRDERRGIFLAAPLRGELAEDLAREACHRQRRPARARELVRRVEVLEEEIRRSDRLLPTGHHPRQEGLQRLRVG